MSPVTFRLWQAAWIATAGAVLIASADADCNCRNRGAFQMASQPGATYSPGLPQAPIPDPNFSQPYQPLPGGLPPAPAGNPPSLPNAQPRGLPPAAPPPQMTTDSPPGGDLPTPPVVNRFDVAPPAGTLGRTYQQRSTLTPDDRHPRWAAVDVHLPENVDVSARGLKAKWTGKVWRLETETPLLPGVPHIYAVKAERDTGNGDQTVDVRWVRLIMGRVVELDF